VGKHLPSRYEALGLILSTHILYIYIPNYSFVYLKFKLSWMFLIWQLKEGPCCLGSNFSGTSGFEPWASYQISLGPFPHL
jgi:hypothetical protein